MDFNFSLPGLGRPASSRPKRVAEAIRNELSLLLLQRVRDPRLGGVTITLVEVAPDLKRAKVYYAVPEGGNENGVRSAMERARGFFRSHLAASINLRYTPELIFFQDRHNEEMERLEELFAQIHREEKA